jgi:hypothetical protein
MDDDFLIAETNKGWYENLQFICHSYRILKISFGGIYGRTRYEYSESGGLVLPAFRY